MEKIKCWSQYTSIKQFENLETKDSLWLAIKSILAVSALIIFMAGSAFVGLSI